MTKETYQKILNSLYPKMGVTIKKARIMERQEYKDGEWVPREPYVELVLEIKNRELMEGEFKRSSLISAFSLMSDEFEKVTGLEVNLLL